MLMGIPAIAMFCCGMSSLTSNSRYTSILICTTSVVLCGCFICHRLSGNSSCKCCRQTVNVCLSAQHGFIFPQHSGLSAKQRGMH